MFGYKYRIEEFLYQIQWAYQRVVRGWDDRAVWDTANWMAENMVKILPRLKETKVGVPLKCLPTDTNDFSDEEINEGSKKFDVILDKITLGFQSHLDIENIEFNGNIKDFEAKRDELVKLRNEGLDLIKEYYHELWD